MTRILSELLGTHELSFRSGITSLESTSGHTSIDVRLTAEVLQAAQGKLHELGLDPHDTTGPELYAALQARLKADDVRLAKALQAAAQGDDLVASVVHALKSVPIPRSCFALKAPIAKRLLHKNPPKKAMKQLGYRSLESMLKHEPAASLYAAAWLLESPTWRKSLTDQYKHLRATDFEVRDIAILHPTSNRWQVLAHKIVAQKKHNVLGFKELGAIVLLPLPVDHPPAATITTLSLALESMNEIRAASTFLKLCQVKPDFGSIVQTVAAHEPELSTELLDRPVAWQLIQRYYGRFKDAFRSDIFVPHIQNDDLSWHSIEQVLADLDPTLEFWVGTSHLGMLHEHAPVSFNIIDVALGYCNQLSFADRITRSAQHSLRHELLLRYLKHENVEQTVLSQLQSELVAEPALI